MKATELEPAWDSDPINQIIAAGNFDDNDLDMGTGGFCGSFALVLHRRLRELKIPADLYLLCVVDEHGKPKYSKNHQGRHEHLLWRHALVRVRGTFYDIYGRCQLAHAIANYCWGSQYEGGSAVKLSPSQFIQTLKATPNSYSSKYAKLWYDKLKSKPLTF